MKVVRIPLIVLLLCSALFAQIDRSVFPSFGPAPEVKIAEPVTFVLDNGLKVFVVTNHRLPSVSFQLIIDRDNLWEGEDFGTASAAGTLMKSGTTTRTKQQIDKEIDFIGGSLMTFSTGMYGQSLKKHTAKLFELMTDVLLHPAFRQEELDTYKKRQISSLAAASKNSSSIAETVRRKVVFGEGHPFSQTETEATVQNITVDKLKKYYQTYFKPNISYLSVVGSIEPDEVRELLNKYWSTWKADTVPNHTFGTPGLPEYLTAVIVDRPEAVQSTVLVSYPVSFEMSDADYFAGMMMNNILGGSSARLFVNLREKHAYTYGAYSSLSPSDLIGNFRASADVRNSVTDSAFTQILFEMNRLRDSLVSDTELQKIKNYLSGTFALSLENPQTVSNFAINREIFKLPADYYKNYLKSVEAVNAEDIRSAARKYLQPDRAYLIAVGKADEIKAGIEKLTGRPILHYSDEGKPLVTSNVSNSGLVNPDSVIEKYISAIGGRQALQFLDDRVTNMQFKLDGVPLVVKTYQKSPGKLFQIVTASTGSQSTYFTGDAGYIVSVNGVDTIDKSRFEELQFDSDPRAILNLKERGISVTYLETQEDSIGRKYHKIGFTFPSGNKRYSYFEEETGLKIREDKIISVSGGEYTQSSFYADFRKVDDYLFPYVIVQSTSSNSYITFSVQSIEVNKRLPDKLFEMKK